MQTRQNCDPKDMVQFLLALCRHDDSSTTPVSRDDDFDTCFKECFKKVVPVANLEEMRQKLDILCVFRPHLNPTTL